MSQSSTVLLRSIRWVLITAIAGLFVFASASSRAASRSASSQQHAVRDRVHSRRRIHVHHTRRVQAPAARNAVAAAATVLGKTSVGSNSDGGFASNVKRVNAYSLDSAGAFKKLSIYLQPTSVAGSETLKGVIYADAGGRPGALLAASNQLTFSNTNAAGWYDLPLPTSVAAKPGKYWIGVLTGGKGGVAGYRWDRVAGARDINRDSYWDGASNPYGGVTTDSEQMAIYATYSLTASAPNPPTGLTASAGDGQVTLSWTAATDPGGTVAGYYVFRNGSRVANVTSGTRYTDSAVTNGSNYSYYVQAYDSTGLASAASGTASASPAAAASSSSAPSQPGSSFDWYGSFACGCIDSSLYPIRSYVPGHAYVTADPAGSGKKVVALSVSNTDQPYAGSYPRADLFSPYSFGEGSDKYISIPVKLPADAPPVTNNDFFQWFQLDHAGEPSNPIMDAEMLAWNGDTQNHYWFRLLNTGSTYPSQPWYNTVAGWRGPVVDGNWHTLTIHVHFTSNTSDGTVDLWWDGVRQTFNVGPEAGQQTAHGATLQCAHYLCPDGVDIDQYRSPTWYSGTVTVYHGAPSYGSTYASVADSLSSPAGP
jgi:Polysaccharide lyase